MIVTPEQIAKALDQMRVGYGLFPEERAALDVITKSANFSHVLSKVLNGAPPEPLYLQQFGRAKRPYVDPAIIADIAAVDTERRASLALSAHCRKLRKCTGPLSAIRLMGIKMALNSSPYPTARRICDAYKIPY